jgi:hypothetical protein
MGIIGVLYRHTIDKVMIVMMMMLCVYCTAYHFILNFHQTEVTGHGSPV